MKPSNPYKPALAALVLTLAALLLATCPNPAISDGNPGGESGPGVADAPAGTGLAVIQLDTGSAGNAARTAVPDRINREYTFILYFTPDGGTTPLIERMLRNDTRITVPLETGKWALEVNAYTGSGQDLALKGTGTTTFTIAEDTTTTFKVSLELSPDFGGTGNFTYDISVPPSTRGWLGLYPLDVPGFSGAIFTGTGDNVLECYLSPNAEGKATGAANGIPGGTYRAVIDLYNPDDNRFAVYSTIVHIYEELTTPLDRTFSLAGSFADCPEEVGDGLATLADKLDAALLPGAPEECTIVLDGTETDLAGFPSTTLSPASGNKTITIRGNGKTVQVAGAGSLFTLNAASGSSLTLELRDVTLKGLTGNTAGLVRVESGAALELRAGSRITGNQTDANGGGVYVAAGGTLTLNGGAVSGNTVSAGYGGGVCIAGGGTFQMNGGAVSGNKADNENYGGGGVYVTGSNARFEMSGGAVSGNKAPTISGYSGYGGGVAVAGGGTLTLSGGAVNGNTANSYGGGVYVTGSSARFEMNGGSVGRNNSYTSRGGGVSVIGSNAGFDMSGGEVSGNTAVSGGGGVSVNGGTFTMSGGKVSDNITSSGGGGGVLVMSGTRFEMRGGEVSRNKALAYGATGGGVYISYATATLSNGIISGNSAHLGGGVYVTGSDARFEMSGGTISGNTAITGGGVHLVYGNARFEMSGGAVGGNTASNYGGEVYAEIGIFTMSADARPERVLLGTVSITTISGRPLSGGKTKIDLPITNLTVGRQILKPDGAQKERFELGNTVPASAPYTAAPITGYMIGDDGTIQLVTMP